MDAAEMQAMLAGIKGKRAGLTDPATLTDEQLVTEFEATFQLRTATAGASANDKKAQTMRLRALAAEKEKREAAQPERKSPRRKAEAAVGSDE